MFTVAFISGIYVFTHDITTSFSSYTLLLSIINSLSFSLATVCHIQALKYSSSSIVYPYIRLNIVLVVCYSYFILGEMLNKFQISGILSSIVAMFLITIQFKDNSLHKGYSYSGFTFATIAMICGAISSISCRYAARSIDKFVFIFLSYVLSTIFLIIALKLSKIHTDKKYFYNIPLTLTIGIFMGILNMLGFYFYLTALSLAPLSIVATINGMHFVVGVILSFVIFKEKITRPALIGLMLTTISLVLLTHF
jgi:drug/metabolite transporter (DMT)-like permease